VVAHHEPIIERLIRLGRRNQTALTAAAAALLLVAIVATASAFQISRNYEQSKYLVGFIRKSFERMPPEAVESNDLSVFIQSLGDSYLENDELFERAGQYAVDFHQAIGNAHLRLGSDSDDLEQRLNQYEKTTSFFVRSLTTLRDSGCKEEDLEVVVHNLAGSYFGTGVVLEKMAKQRTLDDNLAASTLDELARAQGAFADAKKVYQQSYEIKRKKHGIANNKTLGAKEMVGRCLYRQAKIYRTNSQPNLAMESATESVSVLNGVYEDRLALSGLDKKTLYAKERLNEARGLLSQIGKSSDSN
jgi:hypothetical protein